MIKKERERERKKERKRERLIKRIPGSSTLCEIQQIALYDNSLSQATKTNIYSECIYYYLPSLWSMKDYKHSNEKLKI